MPLWKCPGAVSSCHMAARVHQSHNLNYAFNSIEMKAKLEDSVANPPHHKKHFDRPRSIERNIGLDWLLLVTLGYSCIFDCECICCFSATTCGLLSDVPVNVQKSPPGMFCWCNATVIPSWGGGFCLIFGTDIFRQFLLVKKCRTLQIAFFGHKWPPFQVNNLA